MSFMLADHIENAYTTLTHNRGRTLLAVLGITIGIASVTCILAISSGVRQMIGGQITNFSGSLIVIRPGIQTRDPNAIVNPVAQQSFSTSTLTDADVQALTGMQGVSAVAPIMTLDSSLTINKTVIKNNVVLATTPDFQKVDTFSMQAGQFLDNTTDNNTAVIGQQLSVDAFGTDQSIGQVFEMHGQRYTVIGVIKNSNNPINYNNVDLNEAVVVNYQVGELMHQGRSQIQQIDMLASNNTIVNSVISQAHTKLIGQHLGEEDFTITTGSDITKPTNQLFIAITSAITAIAAISLFVGSIGVMNIMLVGVAERTREIGIRKAVGASHGTIITQFLVESLIMSLLGGVLGYFFGYLAAFTISVFLYFTPTFNWQTVAAAMGMSLVVGVVFGIYPALKAAQKDTIESLRQYR